MNGRVVALSALTGVLVVAFSATSQAGKTLTFRSCASSAAVSGTDRYAVAGGVLCSDVRWFVTHEFRPMKTGTTRRFGHLYICSTARAKGGQAVQCLRDARVYPGQQQRAFRFRVRS